MTTQSPAINPGPGYRLLEVGEVTELGDEFYCDLNCKWFPRESVIGVPLAESMRPTRRALGEAAKKVKEEAV
jgi:hypothetical protein